MTDSMGWGALGLDTLQRKTTREDLDRLARIIGERNVGRVLVGLPLHMDGGESPMAKEARRIAVKLGEITGVPVELRDERLTSVEAEERLTARGWDLRRYLEEKKRGAVDQMAAMILLEDYLRSLETSA